MKRIILLRHAKSSWDDPNLIDFDRPLAEKGIKDIPKVAQFMNKSNLTPDIITCSDAKRAIMTHSLLLKEIKQDIKTNFDNIIYEGDEKDIINLISNTSNSFHSHMIIGHNPVIESIAEKLTKKSFPYEKFGTASAAVVEFDTKEWGKIKELKGKLVIYISPKLLKNKK